MDQQFEYPQECPQEPETSQVETPYRLPFAEDLYEAPAQIQQAPQKVHKPKKEKHRGGMPAVAWIALVLVIALVSSLVTAIILDARWQEQFDSMRLAMQDKNTALQDQINAMDVAPGAAAPQYAGSGWLTPGQVYERNVDAVVAISCYGSGDGMFGYGGTYQSMGSGFIISQDGYVVSNYHVVQDTDTIEVITADATYDAALVGYDATNDIALLKVEAEGLPFVTLGSSTRLLVGDQVVAIGNPLGELTSTLTVGYISAKDRIVTTDGSTINMIQTDAAINSGNSGGPLFNMKGEVVGITTAKFSGMSESGVSIEGIGFAIPMDDVIGMIEDLRDLGYVSGAYLGVMVKDVDPAAQEYGLPAGAYVDEVTPGYAAEAAGILAQDIIIDLGGYEIGSVTELTRMLRKFEPGQTVSVTVYRAGRQVTLQVTLDEKPRELTQDPVQQPQQAYPMPGTEGFEEWYRQFMEEFFG